MSALIGAVGAMTRRKGESDPYWSSVVSLLHCDGSNGGDLIPDERGKAWTVSSGVRTDTTQKKFGSASLSFGGYQTYAESPASSDWDFGTGDFTVEAQVMFRDFSNTCTLIGNYANSDYGWTFQRRSNNTLSFAHGDAFAIQRSWEPPNNTWFHIAVAREGANLRLFAGGDQLGSAESNSMSISGSAAPMRLGALQFQGYQQFFSGWLDEVRITKGVARYTAPFVPPPAPFPAG